METSTDASHDFRRVRLRLTAAWALSEGLLGGVLHAFKIPFTGLVVGSAAVICLALLGWYRDRPGQLLRATLVVMVVKAVLSPHAPLPAYLAVFFQGVLAEAILRGRRTHPFACVVLGALALAESAVQKLIVLTLLFGNTFWQATDAFLSGLLQQFGFVPAAYAEWLAGAYMGLHLMTGLAVGVWAGRLSAAPLTYSPVRMTPEAESADVPIPVKGRRHWAWKAAWATVLLAILIWEPTWLPRHEAWRLLLRAGAVLLVWYWLLAPVLTRRLRDWLARQQRHRLAADVDAVLKLLPEIRQLLHRAWLDAAAPGRWRHFVRLAATRVVSADS